MAQLIPAGAVGSPGHPDVSQGAFRQQLDAVTDMLRQIVGNANVAAGSGERVDPLSAPFTLHVNPYTGRDTFVGGSYNTFEDGATDEEIIASKLKRLEKQRLTCGFTPQRPFKTINRACIEAAIITSKNWYTYTDPRAHVDCVSIVLAPGVHTAYTDPGNSVGALPITEWADDFEPTPAHLIAFNGNTGGIILPRGCSIPGPDLRKCTIRPSWVPVAQDEAADYSNRRAIFKVTGTGFFFGFTFMDKVGHTESIHLLDAFHFASKAELDDFYSKCFTAVGAPADLSAVLTVTRGTEYEIVGPIDQSQSPTATWDTTASASPYIFNCSIRSDYGMGGIFADGAKVSGLKSIVTAQFTGVSLQRDMNSWQVYKNGNWTAPANYTEYIAASPDDVRMKPERVSRHIQAINDAFIQEVSVFAIGQGIHHYTDNGGEITITNSNSSFGGCAAISKGYKSAAFPQDSNWAVSLVRVPRTVEEKTGNIKRVFLGSIQAVTPTQITLEVGIAASPDSATIPAPLLKDGYTFREDSYLWVENPTGPDWRAPLAASAWNDNTPDIVAIKSQLVEAGTAVAAGEDAIGRRIYIRRVVDTRTPAERRCSLEISNTASARLPENSFVLQTDPVRANGAIDALLPNSGEGVLLVTSSGKSSQITEAVRNASITIRRGASPAAYATNTYYRAGAVVRYANKHYQASKDHLSSGAAPDPAAWSEAFVHMPTLYYGEDPARGETPVLIFDHDTDANEVTTTCGIDWATIYTATGGASVRGQLRSGTDYIGVYTFLRQLGFSDAAAHAALLPRPEASRNLNPTSAADFPTAPAGGAATALGNWAIEFRRPSVLRLYGHAWEWAGWLNYSKSIPAAQQQLSALNKFTYYFTNWNGGRVVPQGSNEDGFNVTPRGLENIETGETKSVDNLDFPDIDVPSVFENLLVNNLAVEGILDFSGVTQSVFPDGLFPFLPDVGDAQASIILKSLGIGQAPDANFALALNGAGKGSVVDLGSGTAIDCRLGNYFTRAVAGNATFTFANPPAAGRFSFTLDIAYTSGAVTFPAGVKWVYESPPGLIAGYRYQLIFVTVDAGATWLGTPLEYAS